MNVGNPATKNEIVETLKIHTTAVHGFFRQIPAERFFEAPENVWSSADNLAHLIKSISPVGMALGLPKVALRLRFGGAKHETRTFNEIVAIYTAALNDGTAVASGRFLPEVSEATAEERERILAKWLAKGEQLSAVVESWPEAKLDQLVLPHPILGDMTVREMLFFTIYHNMHHVNDVKQLLA